MGLSNYRALNKVAISQLVVRPLQVPTTLLAKSHDPPSGIPDLT